MLKRFLIHIKKYAEGSLIVILTGVFMFLVLYVYKGYDIDQQYSFSGHGLLFRAITYGLATSAVFYCYEFPVRRKIRIEGLLHTLLWHAAEIFTGINVTFLLFNYFWSWTEFYWSSYALFLYEYPLVVIFPIILAKLAANRFPGPIKGHIVFKSENGKSALSIDPGNLLYIQASDNYVEIYYLVNTEVKKHLLRCSLKNLENTMLPNPYLVRCHRSYMVNPNKIERVIHGKTKTLFISSVSIPVSKKYEDLFN